MPIILDKTCEQDKKYYSGGWNTEHVLYTYGCPQFSFPKAFGFPMAFHFEQNGGNFVQSHWKLEQNGSHFVPISNGSVLVMVGISKPNHWEFEFELQNIWYSIVFPIQVFN